MSHSMRKYGDEINDKDNNSMRFIRSRDTQEPYEKNILMFLLG